MSAAPATEPTERVTALVATAGRAADLPVVYTQPLMWDQSSTTGHLHLATASEDNRPPVPCRLVGFRTLKHHTGTIAVRGPLALAFVADVATIATHISEDGLCQWDITTTHFLRDPSQLVSPPPELQEEWETAQAEHPPPDSDRRGEMHPVAVTAAAPADTPPTTVAPAQTLCRDPAPTPAPAPPIQFVFPHAWEAHTLFGSPLLQITTTHTDTPLATPGRLIGVVEVEGKPQLVFVATVVKGSAEPAERWGEGKVNWNIECTEILTDPNEYPTDTAAADRDTWDRLLQYPLPEVGDLAGHLITIQ